jgi:hypothetical protein
MDERLGVRVARPGAPLHVTEALEEIENGGAVFVVHGDTRRLVMGTTPTFGIWRGPTPSPRGIAALWSPRSWAIKRRSQTNRHP